VVCAVGREDAEGIKITFNIFCKREHLTYNAEKPCCNEHPIPVLLIMTSNAPDGMYKGLIENYQQVLSRFVGPTEIFVSGDTLQLKDYGKTDWHWTPFDPDSKKLRHETVPSDCCHWHLDEKTWVFHGK
jgi:hypothetical protein